MQNEGWGHSSIGWWDPRFTTGLKQNKDAKDGIPFVFFFQEKYFILNWKVEFWPRTALFNHQQPQRVLRPWLKFRCQIVFVFFCWCEGWQADLWGLKSHRYIFVNRQNAVSLFRFLVAWEQYNYFKNLLKLSFWKFEAKCCFHTSWGRQLKRFQGAQYPELLNISPLMVSHP